MNKFLISGGKKLDGQLSIPCAKNAYLPIMAATLLCDKPIVLHKCPNFSDIFSMQKIIESLGGKTYFDGDSLIIDNSGINSFYITHELSSAVRSSIFALGAILGRFKKAKVAYPGGCEIGARPIDLHIKGLKALNVKIEDKHGYLTCDGSKMKGAAVSLDFPSVGATENIMLAGVLIDGETKIFNAAMEPEIVDLANFLNMLGAKIYGAGTKEISILGVKSLSGGHYTPIPDRIIAGTYLMAGIMAGGKMAIKNFKLKHNMALIEKLKESSCKFSIKNDILTLVADRRLKSISKIETSPYPGFPTDLQAQMLALQTISQGHSVIVENMFETRFKHVPELIKMGAKITIKDKTAIINGTEKLYGADVNAADLRGGAALVLAALASEGYTTINNVNYIDRGYENFEKVLTQLGADIKRIWWIFLKNIRRQ